jgi:hypothetical protein
MLIINLPGGQHENFFLTVGDRMDPGTTEFTPMPPRRTCRGSALLRPATA